MSRVLKTGANQVTQKYKKGLHNGIDIVKYKASLDYIIAHSDGEVVSVRNNYKTTDSTGNSYGNYVKIKHNNGYYTLYAHLKYGSVTVKSGSKVSKGQTIGYMGATGHCKSKSGGGGAHLHFEVRTGSGSETRINPTPYIDADLPTANKITYQVYDNKKKKWLNNITVGKGAGIMAYAGNFGNSIGGLKIDNLKYRVHDKVKNKWLNWIEGRNGSGIQSYAGNLGNSIDGLQIEKATYRVHLKYGGWLSWISKVDDSNKGYAGIYGKEIDAIQIKVG